MLKNLDCLEYLKTLDSKSVDLVLVDPPYFGIVNNEWDNQWPTELEYLEWCEQWTKECARVLKDNRMLVVWGTLKTDTFLNYKLNVLNKIDSLKSQTEIIWHYNWGGRTKSNFGRKSELAWCYSKGDTFLFNADDVRVERTITSDMNKGKKLLEEYKNKFEKEHAQAPIIPNTTGSHQLKRISHTPLGNIQKGRISRRYYRSLAIGNQNNILIS